MGSAKRHMERDDAEQAVGIEIGVRAGERCDGHEECYWMTGEGEREAYKLASALGRDGDALVAGIDEQELLNGAEVAVGNAGIDGCPRCTNILAKD